MKCNECIFWNPWRDKDNEKMKNMGRCVRNSPNLIVGNLHCEENGIDVTEWPEIQYAVWPFTFGDVDCCGEFKEKQKTVGNPETETFKIMSIRAKELMSNA